MDSAGRRRPIARGGPLPADYTILTSQRLVLSRLWGVVTQLDMYEYRARIANDPRFESDYSELADLTGIVVSVVPSKIIAESMAMVPFDAGVRRALVVTSAQREATAIIATAVADHGHVVRVFASV